MGAVQYKAISFAKNDTITKTIMDDLQSNYQWIYENTPRGRFYNNNGDPRDARVVILGGKARIKKNNKSDSARTSVNFGRSFHPNCQPHVTTGIISDFQRRIFCAVSGPPGRAYPTSNGFEIKVNIAADNKKNDKIKRDFWIAWQAHGFRRDDMNEF